MNNSFSVKHAGLDKVMFFDGVCNLCNSGVNFIIDRDEKGLVSFAPLQSELAKKMLVEAGAGMPGMDTMYFLEDGKIYERSTAALRVARYLGYGWRLLAAALLLIPVGLRNRLYDWVANNRYRWFGRQEVCRIPTPELRSRFIEMDPVEPAGEELAVE